MRRAEPGQRIAHVQRRPDGFGVVLRQCLGYGILGHLGRPRLAHPDLVYRDVVRDLDQPAANRPFLLAELAAVPPCAQHRFLDDVLGEMAVLQQAGDVAEHEGAVLAVQTDDDRLGVLAGLAVLASLGAVRRGLVKRNAPYLPGAGLPGAGPSHPSSPSVFGGWSTAAYETGTGHGSAARAC